MKRYIARQLSPEELEEFFRLIQEDGEHYMPEVEDVPERDVPEPQADIVGNILLRERNARVRRLVVRYAAACIVAALLLVGGPSVYKYYTWQRLTTTFETVQVPVGTTKTILLDDSSTVVLTSGSVFSYPKAFERDKRNVSLLEGQAFFEVASDASRPFTVESGGLKTTALGTSFTVQRYSRQGYIKVNLYTGKVRVEGQQEGVTLLPGEGFRFDAGSGKGEISHFEVLANPLQSGGLVFDKTPFDEALYSIASYYQVNLHFDRKVFSDRQITGEYLQSSLEDVLSSLAFIQNLTINKIDNQNYSIMKPKNKP